METKTRMREYEIQDAVYVWAKNDIIRNQDALVRACFEKDVFSYDDIENMVEDEVSNYPEVFEWWMVSEWMAGKLSEDGQVVLRNEYGTWWGRCTTGQAWILDGCVRRIWKTCNDI